jgi:hypothetical protein
VVLIRGHAVDAYPWKMSQRLRDSEIQRSRILVDFCFHALV